MERYIAMAFGLFILIMMLNIMTDKKFVGKPLARINKKILDGLQNLINKIFKKIWQWIKKILQKTWQWIKK